MAEIDLTNPEHLADILSALPGLEDETPARVQPHIEALERSDNDLFALVGTGRRIDEDAPVEQAAPEQDAQQQAPPEEDEAAAPEEEELGDFVQGPPEAEEAAPEQEKDLGDFVQGPPEAEEAAPEEDELGDFVQGQPEEKEPPPQEALPLDMGGEGELLEEGPDVATELAGLPVRARRGWTDFDRQRTKGLHEIYLLEAAHTRGKPIRSKFTGECQAVRVRLPTTKRSSDAFIGTWIGTVEAKDHLLFSVEEFIEHYDRTMNQRPVVARVDLITGARFRGRRFSPVSIYLGYARPDENAKPTIYMLEGGSAKGEPEALYVSRSIHTEIKTQANFQFTPFACKSNWYEGGLAMSQDKSEPACVYLTSAQTRDGRHQYIQLSVTYTRDRELRRVIHPFELQVEASLRVMAIADEAGCQLRTGAGGILQHSLGPAVRSLMQWDEAPTGTTTPQERRQFCGCPEN